MIQQAVQIRLNTAGGRIFPLISPAAGLPLDRLMIGRPVVEVAEMLPRLFNLCRHAQARAAQLSAGLDRPKPTLGHEILRDHLMRISLFLPRAAGLSEAAPEDLAPLPNDLGSLAEWAMAPNQAARLVQFTLKSFTKGEAMTNPLPAPIGILQGAFENSPAGRQSAHPLLLDIQSKLGRGPLWRLVGLMVDAHAAKDKLLPDEQVFDDGTAVVAASRGGYALRITQAEGRVTSVTRRTPTDHILANGGALEQALANLPAAKVHLAPFVLALHDPCVPVTLREPTHA